MSELPRIATVAEVARYLGWTESKLRNRIDAKSGHPPYTREGRRIEFARDDVLAWEASRAKVMPADVQRIVPRRTRRTSGVWPTRAGQQVAGH